MQQQFRFDKRALGALVLALAALAWPRTSQAGTGVAQAKDAPRADGTSAPNTPASTADGTAAAPSQDAAGDEEDLSVDPVQPDFTLAALPTSVRLPRYKLAFRVTHRFTRPFNQGSFSESLSDFFGMDSGAQIGLELRFAPIKGGQVGVYRTNLKTIEFFGQYDLLHESASTPLSVNPVFTIEGTNNFQDSYSPSIGVVVSRTLGKWGAVYVEPTWVNNSNPQPSALVDHNDTFMIGIGTRIRIRPSLYLVGEVAPRVSGFKPDHAHNSFGIEKRVGGHMFQVNFSNHFGTTPAEIARGAATTSDWYLGFNITRKFY